jgi:hypothetical protein
MSQGTSMGANLGFIAGVTIGAIKIRAAEEPLLLGKIHPRDYHDVNLSGATAPFFAKRFHEGFEHHRETSFYP